jgi:alanine racemase
MNQYIFLNKKQYQENYIALKKFYGTNPAICLKNNSYGLGINDIVLFLDEIFCDKYFVSSVEEGIIVRNNTKTKCEIYILQSIFPNKTHLYEKYNLIPAVSSFDEIDTYKDFLKRVKFILYFDTGMHGKGILYTEINNLINNLKTNSIPFENIYMILSHLSTSWRNDLENKNSDKNITNKQKDRFLEIKNILETYNKNIIYSLCNTDGSRLGKEYFFNLPRVGRGIHGMSIYKDLLNVQRAFQIKGPITEIKEIKANTKIGYGGFVSVEKDCFIGIVHIGTEKITRINYKFTNSVLYNGKKYNVLTMFLDYIVIDFEKNKPEYLGEVELIFETRFTADM